jgi:hypothetical protein
LEAHAHQDHQKKPGRRLEMAILRGVKNPTYFWPHARAILLRGEGQKLPFQALNAVCGPQLLHFFMNYAVTAINR